MRSATGATRTLNPVHFEALESHRFEDLVRQLAYGGRTWHALEATGRLGKDEGLDIRGIEVVPLTSLRHMTRRRAGCTNAQ